jgi:hypothetical protein
MTKTILITAAAFTAMLQAQNSFQSSAWLGSPNGPQMGLRLEGQPGPVTGKPFSGIENRETRQVLSDGSPVTKTSVTKIFRDAEGRMRSDAGTHVILFDAPTLTNYVTDPNKCTRQTVRAGDAVIIAATEHGTSISSNSGSNSHPNPNLKVEDLGVQVINGISAKGTRQTLTIPGKNLGSDHDINVVNERWYSDALGILIKSSNTDPRFGTTTYELTSINLSTPPTSLFTAPTGCTEFQSHH